MAMSILLCSMFVVSIIYSLFNNTTLAVASALLTGAQDAVMLAIGMCGVLCLWSGVVEVMRQSGLSEKLAKLLGKPLGFLFPETKTDADLRGDIAAAVSANILGLGNAATPLSIRACTRLHKQSGNKGVATDSICMLVILGAVSIQLIPATIAAARASCGATNPFDILPAVWFATVISCGTGVFFGKLFAWGGKK